VPFVAHQCSVARGNRIGLLPTSRLDRLERSRPRPTRTAESELAPCLSEQTIATPRTVFVFRNLKPFSHPSNIRIELAATPLERRRRRTERLGHRCRPAVPRSPRRFRGHQMGSRPLRRRSELANEGERAGTSIATSRSSHPRALRGPCGGQRSKLARYAASHATTELEIPIDRHGDQRWPYTDRLLLATRTDRHDSRCLKVGDRCCDRRLHPIGLHPIACQCRCRMDRSSRRSLFWKITILNDISRKAGSRCRFSPCLWYNNGIEPIAYLKPG